MARRFCLSKKNKKKFIMLTNQRITIVADTVIDDVKIANFCATMNLDTMSMSLSARNIDEHACKVYRDVVRTDRAAFEDFAYEVQESIGLIKGTESK